jgi:hypothetical protein
VILFLAAIIAAQLAGTPQPSSTEQKFVQGETLDYNLTWLKITGGTARMTIQPHGDDSFRITSIARSTPSFSRFFRVRDEIETTVARSDFSTTRYVKRLDEDGDTIEEVTVVEDSVATRTRKKVKKVRVPRPVFDPISVIYLLRMRDLTPGKVHDFQLIADGKLYSVRPRRPQGEGPDARRHVPVHPRRAADDQRRSGAPGADVHLCSDDERRIVRIRTEVKFGAVTATLRGVAASVNSVDPAARVEAKK